MKKIKYETTESGAGREALNMHYMRQIPLESMAAGAAALEYGAMKYDHRNWEKGLPWQQMIDSLQRHINDFERGHDFDNGPDGSGMHQVCLIMASAMMLSASVIRGVGTDNRMPRVSAEAFTSKECSKFIMEQLDMAKDFNEMHFNDEDKVENGS